MWWLSNCFYFTLILSGLTVIFIFVPSTVTNRPCGPNCKLHQINWWQIMPSKPFWKILAALILSTSTPLCVAWMTKGDKVLLNISHPSQRPTYLIDMPPTVRLLHFAVVSIEASVRPANEFCLLFFTVLIAKPATIESINGAFNPLNHAVDILSSSVPSSFHNPHNFKWSLTKASQKWV